MDKIFKDAGKDIMILAKVCACINSIFTLIMFLVYISDGRVEIALFILFVGIFFVISAWPLYGFGQMVQEVHEIKLGLTSQVNTSGSGFTADDELPEL